MRPNSANTQIVFNWMSSYLRISAYFEIPRAHNSMDNGFFGLSCFTYLGGQTCQKIPQSAIAAKL